MVARAKARYELTAEDKTAAAFASVNKRLGAATKAIGGFGAAIAGAVSIGGLGSLVQRSIDAGDRIQKLAIQTGASTEFLSELGHAARLTGTQFEPAVKSIQQMQRTAVEAARGTKSYADAYKELGIDAKAFAELGPEEQLEIMADRLGALDNDAQRSAIAMQLFGKSGRDLLPLLREGSTGIRAMREEARDLGLSLSRDQADSMAEANDALERLSASFAAVGNTLAIEFAPQIAQGADVLRTALVPVLRGVGSVFSTVGRTLGGFAAAVVALLSGDFRAAAELARLTFGDLRDDIVEGAGVAADALRQLSASTVSADQAQAVAGTTAGAFSFGQDVTDQPKSAQVDRTNELLEGLLDTVRAQDNAAVAG